MRDFTVCRATPDDVPAAAALAREAFLAAVAPHYSAEGVHTFLAFAAPERILERMRENSATYLARRGDELVGMAQVRAGAHLAMLFVAPRAQRSGVGRALLAAAVADCPGAVVTVNASPNAEAAYLRFGFKRTAAEQLEHGIRFIPMALEKEGCASPAPVVASG